MVSLVFYCTFFWLLCCLVGCQFRREGVSHYRYPDELYIPISPIWTTLVEFLFYGGSMKVAEKMANTFGDDKKDFNLNFLIVRHVQVV